MPHWCMQSTRAFSVRGHEAAKLAQVDNEVAQSGMLELLAKVSVGSLQKKKGKKCFYTARRLCPVPHCTSCAPAGSELTCVVPHTPDVRLLEFIQVCGSLKPVLTLGLNLIFNRRGQAVRDRQVVLP